MSFYADYNIDCFGGGQEVQTALQAAENALKSSDFEVLNGNASR